MSCDDSIILKILAEFCAWTEISHDNLTLTRSTEKCWLERDLNSHLQDTGPPLYLLNYRIHRDWRRVLYDLSARYIHATT